jgi:hypothetical protein
VAVAVLTIASHFLQGVLVEPVVVVMGLVILEVLPLVVLLILAVVGVVGLKFRCKPVRLAALA